MGLPFWFSEEQVNKLRAAAAIWFDLLQQWAMWPAMQMDPETCCEQVLDLIAWQRDITRFNGEPLSLYRLRVKYAYANARDAGSVAGFKRIFMRLGIGYVEIEERMPDRDWDIVAIQLTDSQLSENQDLLEVLIQHYGRTCRRYEWTILTPLSIRVWAHEFMGDYQLMHAKIPANCIALRVHDLTNDYQTVEASL